MWILLTRQRTLFRVNLNRHPCNGKVRTSTQGSQVRSRARIAPYFLRRYSRLRSASSLRTSPRGSSLTWPPSSVCRWYWPVLHAVECCCGYLQRCLLRRRSLCTHCKSRRARSRPRRYSLSTGCSTRFHYCCGRDCCTSGCGLRRPAKHRHKSSGSTTRNCKLQRFRAE